VGTNGPPLGDALPISQNTTTPKDESTIRADFATNVPINSAISNLSEPAEQFCESPWSPETLIGLAQSRHRPDIFEIRDDDEDYEMAEKLIGLAKKAGDNATQAWQRIDCHIAWMVDDSSPSWWVKERADRSLVTLKHVANNWRSVERKIAEKNWSTMDTAPYYGPPRDFEEPRPRHLPPGVSPFGDDEEISVPLEESVEGEQSDEALPDGFIFPGVPLRPRVPKVPGEAKPRKERKEPPSPWAFGLLYGYAENLIETLKPSYPGVSMRIIHVGSCYHHIRVGYAQGHWIDLDSAENARRRIDQALANYNAENALPNKETGEIHGDHSEGGAPQESEGPPRDDGG
jgi:hypothetical protein